MNAFFASSLRTIRPWLSRAQEGHFCAETRDEARTALVALADASVFFAGAFVDADLVDRDRTDDDEVRGEGDALREGLVLPDECPLCAISAGACHVKNAGQATQNVGF